MSQSKIIKANGRIYVYSFTTGVVESQPTQRPLTDHDIQARALWLENQGQADEAWLLLEELLALKAKGAST